MNSFGYERSGITKQELDTLSRKVNINEVSTFLFTIDYLYFQVLILIFQSHQYEILLDIFSI